MTQDAQVKKMIDALHDLGFPHMANTIETSICLTEYHFDSFFSDLRKARRDCTEEEFPEEDYNQVKHILNTLNTMTEEA